MTGPGTGRGEITVILPPEPPEPNPEAARVPLRTLLKACEKQYGHEYLSAGESEPQGRTRYSGQPYGRPSSSPG